jgi:hypothetical protein
VRNPSVDTLKFWFHSHSTTPITASLTLKSTSKQENGGTLSFPAMIAAENIAL